MTAATRTTAIAMRLIRGLALAALVCCLMLAPRLAAAAQEVVHVEFDGAAGIVYLQLPPAFRSAAPA